VFVACTTFGELSEKFHVTSAVQLHHPCVFCAAAADRLVPLTSIVRTGDCHESDVRLSRRVGPEHDNPVEWL
jgi:hypothetical protein